MRTLSIIIGAALLGLWSTACGVPEAEECPRAIGIFHGRYSYITGTCEPSLQGRALQLQQDDPGNTVRKLTTFSDIVTTEINLIGCTIGLKQEISDAKGTRLISSIRGDLTIEGGEALSGQIFRTEYMPDGSTVRCTGSYNAHYTRAGAPLGGAAESALSR